jgi:predicted NAD/FAD-dependent oxidoreductase
MEDTSGFYKENEVLEWEYAPNYVYAPTYTLLREFKDTYDYPVDGWNWYDEQPEAYLLWLELTENNKTE